MEVDTQKIFERPHNPLKSFFLFYYQSSKKEFTRVNWNLSLVFLWFLLFLAFFGLLYTISEGENLPFVTVLSWLIIPVGGIFFKELITFSSVMYSSPVYKLDRIFLEEDKLVATYRNNVQKEEILYERINAISYNYNIATGVFRKCFILKYTDEVGDPRELFIPFDMQNIEKFLKFVVEKKNFVKYASKSNPLAFEWGQRNSSHQETKNNQNSGLRLGIIDPNMDVTKPVLLVIFVIIAVWWVWAYGSTYLINFLS